MRRLLLLTIAALAVSASLALASPALATGPIITHVSSGSDTGGNGAFNVDQGQLSADGRCAVFTSAEQLSSADQNSRADIYKHCAGSPTTLVSGGTSINAPTLLGVSDDGACVLFYTGDALTGDDLDTRWDIYKRCGGSLERVSQGPAGGNGGFDVNQGTLSADGTCVVVGTSEVLTSTDTDTGFDLYERCGSTTTLLSYGPHGGNGNGGWSSLVDLASDGSCILFDSNEPLTADDTDTRQDAYVRCGSSIERVTTGNGDHDAYADYMSPDGSCVLFETDEQLAAGDTDTTIDIYRRCGTTTTLESPGSADQDVWGAYFSKDASCVAFSTDEALTPDDTDSTTDGYEKCDGAPLGHVTQGPSGGNGAFTTELDYISDDGRCIVFTTGERLTSGDTDTSDDSYKRCGDTTTLVTTGPSGGNADGSNQYVVGMSPGGERVVFRTSEALTPDDTNTTDDVYENSNGATTMISPPRSGNTVYGSNFSSMSRDGSSVLFSRGDSLASSDTDSSLDLYEATTSPTASTGSATDVTQTSATLRGSSFDAPNASYHFEYGTSGSYGSATADQPLPAGTAPHALSAAVSGLSAGTTYHYRLVVTSDGGTTRTADRSFTTAAAQGAATTSGGEQQQEPEQQQPQQQRVDPFAGVQIAAGTIAVKRGVAKLRVTCPATAQSACDGTLALRFGKRTQLGRRAFHVAPGRSVTVSVKLSKAGSKLLASRRAAVKTTATAVAHDARAIAAATSVKLTLRRR